MKIEHTVALVTGANRGIGRALVRALLERGATKVYAAARRESDLRSMGSKADSRIVPVHLDVTNAAHLARVASRAEDLQILFNNAGVLNVGSVLDAPSAAFSENFDVNFFGVLHATRAFVPALTKHRGAVVNILTLVALASMPSLGVYNASKAAAWSLTQSLRGDLARREVKVFGVFPGAVDTDMLKGVEMPKTAPAHVALETLKGIEAGEEDIFPDPMAKTIYLQWTTDHKAIEHQWSAL
ncbi:MAG TPA: SDR family oxidoreductase [Candidatus Polarisedimenticolaceae bacterium]|nr:SDR family oxidoreductase [Candidatus Polarisedimenticolaceae bacterium]